MSDQHILAVEFQSQDGRSWSAVGGGATIAAAIQYAHRSCPPDSVWQAVDWENLYDE
jgi:hypothetical protein